MSDRRTDPVSRIYTDPPEQLSTTLCTVAIAVERLRLRGVSAQQVLLGINFRIGLEVRGGRARITAGGATPTAATSRR